MCLLKWCTKETTMSLLWYSSQNVLPGSYREKIQDKPKLRGIPKSNWSVLFKNVIVMTRLNNCSRSKKTEETATKKCVMMESGQNCHKNTIGLSQIHLNKDYYWGDSIIKILISQNMIIYIPVIQKNVFLLQKHTEVFRDKRYLQLIPFSNGSRKKTA